MEIKNWKPKIDIIYKGKSDYEIIERHIDESRNISRPEYEGIKGFELVEGISKEIRVFILEEEGEIIPYELCEGRIGNGEFICMQDGACHITVNRLEKAKERIFGIIPYKELVKENLRFQTKDLEFKKYHNKKIVITSSGHHNTHNILSDRTTITVCRKKR